MTTEHPQVEECFNENGRLYLTSMRDKYLFPADETEQDRLDIFNQLFKTILGKLTKTSNLGENSHVLDLGCGSGLWAILVAQDTQLLKAASRHRSRHSDDATSIVSTTSGLDFEGLVNHVAVCRIPSTVKFTPADIEVAWTDEMANDAPYDLINCRLMKGSIQSWPALYKKIAANLKLETGVFEQFDIDWQFRCDDGPIPEALKQWSDEVHKAMETHTMSLSCKETRDTLLENGFCNVQEETFMLPINDWKDNDQAIGRWFNTALTQSIFPMALAPLCRISNKTLQDIKELEKSVNKILSSQAQTNGVYCLLYIWTARTGTSQNKSRNKTARCV